MRDSRLVLVFLFAAACAPCTCESADVTHEEHGRRVTIGAAHHAGLGLGAIGAPHAFGIIYPTWEDSGIRLTMTVDDRPAVVVGWAPDGDVDTIAGSVDVAVSDDGEHVAARYGDTWRVFHLLPEGTPFDAPGSEVTADEVDFSTFDAPLDIAVGVLEDAEQEHGTPWALLLEAVEAQDPSPRLDLAVLAGWPEQEAQQGIVTRRLEAETLDPEFADALFARARAFVETASGESAYGPGQAVQRAFVRLGGERLAWLDEHRIAQWESLEGDPDGWLAWYIADRRESHGGFVDAPPLSDELRTRGAVAGRRWLDRALRDGGFADAFQASGYRGTLEWVALEGTDADRLFLHDLFLASWPDGEEGVHDTVLEIAGGSLGEVAPEWRTRAVASAERALDGDRYARAAELTRALDAPQSTKDRAFEALLDHDDLNEMTLETWGREASEASRRRALDRMRALEQSDPHAFTAKRRLAFVLARQLDDCEAMVALAMSPYQQNQIPAACRPPAATPAAP